jgi:hypothetical protein
MNCQERCPKHLKHIFPEQERTLICLQHCKLQIMGNILVKWKRKAQCSQKAQQFHSLSQVQCTHTSEQACEESKFREIVQAILTVFL